MDLYNDHPSGIDLEGLRGSYDVEGPHRFQGDFYCEPDDVVRGTTVSSTFDFVACDLSGYLECDDKVDGGIDLHGDAYRSSFIKERDEPTPCAPKSSFTDEAQPPLLVGQAGVTSVAVEEVSPSVVAAFVRDVLETEVRAIVTKVCPKKFAMKAEAFHDVAGYPLSCTLKARVFRAQGRPCEKAWLVVEFQRRAGDAIAFHSSFMHARRCLLRRFASAGPLQARAAFWADGTAEDSGLSAGASQAGPDDLQPLMDMLVEGSSVTQAEAVAALVALASASAAGACAICTLLADLRGVLPTLLGSDHLKVSYPAARLVSTLAKQADRSVSAPVLGCVVAVGAALDPVVRSELAGVLAQ